MGMLRGLFIKIDPVIVVVVLLSSTCWDSKVPAIMPVKQLRPTLYRYVNLQRQFHFHPVTVYAVTSCDLGRCPASRSAAGSASWESTQHLEALDQGHNSPNQTSRRCVFPVTKLVLCKLFFMRLQHQLDRLASTILGY